ncbi:MAG TPA: hypothetical protein P5180_00910 [Bacteroidales bacterium]|nr:hypothetical protein [Bacteroidales bacterium]HRW83963.1 hypothetical protein [Bacteroidales bacterium]
MHYKSFKEFYWKRAIWNIGIPWGFVTGVLFAIVRNKEVLAYFTTGITLLQILFFILGGFLLAYTLGRNLWKKGNRYLPQDEMKK